MTKFELTRRKLVKAGAAVGFASAMPFGAMGVAAQSSPSLDKYVTTMPVPTVREPDGKRQGADYHEIRMKQGIQELHPDLGQTRIWGYDGQYPGKTIEARRNERVKVKWINDLPDEHLLPVDDTIHGAAGNPEVRTVAHAHGLHTESASDGLPEAWFTQNYDQTGDHFVKEIYDYDNGQPGATLWYHDHALGITRLNVYAGLAGFYILQDNYERSLDLPTGDYDVPILIQDRSFTEEGELFYPDVEIGDVETSIVPEFFGDTSVVNGKVWPKFEVEPRKYRFRVLNGCNSRFINPRLFEVTVNNEEDPDGSTPPVYQIGTDLGFIDQTFQPERINLGPAERAEIIVDFSGMDGKSFVLGDNTASAPFKGPGTTVQEVELFDFMRFDVTLPLDGEDTSSIPQKPGRPDPFGQEQTTRDLPLIESTDDYGRLMNILNQRKWEDGISENPKLGTTEVWNLVNTTEDSHPIHVHLIEFEVVERQPFDAAAYLADLNDEQDPTDDNLDPLEEYYTGDPRAPEPDERGRKDTVQAHPEEITRIKTRFGSHTGRYVWHCHILEHEDHEMMRPYEVVTGGN
ncbi:multicopper oxidase family protein [Halobellus litoreus]|uniref:Multicopper oxidase family protein n=1 Tax=Halobellus litoreus TaxID=755310 RepID=A0ABD6E0A0_9EURY|nr:multicopper oxidase [Halobellus litoreus]